MRDEHEEKFADKDDILTDPYCDVSFLEGATIHKIGFHKLAREGGFAIAYEKDGVEKVVVLGFTELGMWIQACVSITQGVGKFGVSACSGSKRPLVQIQPP